MHYTGFSTKIFGQKENSTCWRSKVVLLLQNRDSSGSLSNLWLDPWDSMEISYAFSSPPLSPCHMKTASERWVDKLEWVCCAMFSQKSVICCLQQLKWRYFHYRLVLTKITYSARQPYHCYQQAPTPTPWSRDDFSQRRAFENQLRLSPAHCHQIYAGLYRFLVVKITKLSVDLR